MDGGRRSDETDDDANKIDVRDVVGVKRMITLLCVRRHKRKHGGRLGEAMKGGARQLQVGQHISVLRVRV